jgi:phytoene synthase
MHQSLRDLADLKACRKLMQGGSRTFFAASLLLPRRIYEPAAALYAFCRLADDAIDDGDCKRSALIDLRARLAQAYEGNPKSIPADRAFARAVEDHNVPRTLPEALLEGFEWDSLGRRYETLADLQDYAARVAGTVGAMMAVLMGARLPHALARACDLGIAMQLTNIARDVGEDARAGRLYLPLSWLRAERIDPDAWLANPVFTPAIGRIVARLLTAADTLYNRSVHGIAALPPSCRPGIRAAGLIYSEIGREIEKLGCDSINHRAHVSATRKLALLARSTTAWRLTAPKLQAPALPAARYLVEASIAPPLPVRRGVSDTIHWLLDLHERLDSRELEPS